MPSSKVTAMAASKNGVTPSYKPPVAVFYSIQTCTAYWGFGGNSSVIHPYDLTLNTLFERHLHSKQSFGLMAANSFAPSEISHVTSVKFAAKVQFAIMCTSTTVNV